MKRNVPNVPRVGADAGARVKLRQRMRVMRLQNPRGQKRQAAKVTARKLGPVVGVADKVRVVPEDRERVPSMQRLVTRRRTTIL